MVDWVLLDFEASSGCDLKAAGSWRYSEDVTTEAICLGYSFNGTDDHLWRPGDPYPFDGFTGMFIAHSAAMEKAMWRNIMVKQYGWPDIPNSRWHDTLAACAYYALPLALEDAASILRLPHQKDPEGRQAVLGLSKFAKSGYVKDRDAKLTKTYSYCGQDVRAEVALHQRLGWLPARERNVWLLDQRINERGVRLDMAFVDACEEIVSRATEPLAAEFRGLTGGLKFTQVDKIVKWADTQGCYLPNLQKETVVNILGSDIDEEEESYDTEDWERDTDALAVPDTVRRALEIRQLINSAAIKKLPRMRACVGVDGRCRGVIQYHAAASGRFGGRLFQPHNYPILTPMMDGEPMDPELVVPAIMTRDPEYVSMALGLPPVHAVIASLRHTITCEDDRELVAADYSGIEARILLAICGQSDKAQMMADGRDVYSDMAELIYGYPVNKKNNPVERDTGKHCVLGLGYRMGAREFFRRYGKGQTFEFCEKAVGTYRKEWAPKVPYFWYGLEEAAFKCVWDGTPQEAYGFIFQVEGEWMTCRLRSGRKLHFYNPQKVKRPMPWDENDIRPGMTYQVMKMGQWRTVFAHGGTFTGIIIQATARDLLVDAMFKCEFNNMPLCLTVHDENVTEPLIKDADPDTLRQIMLDVEPWAREIQVPFAVEVWRGRRYRK